MPSRLRIYQVVISRILSPLTTLSSSGNSPSLVLRRKRPKQASRSASGNGRPSGSQAFIIVLNFTSKNGRP